jgi:hypothetical protein
VGCCDSSQQTPAVLGSIAATLYTHESNLTDTLEFGLNTEIDKPATTKIHYVNIKARSHTERTKSLSYSLIFFRIYFALFGLT